MRNHAPSVFTPQGPFCDGFVSALVCAGLRHGGGVVRLGAPHSPEHGERRVREAAQIVAERGRLEPLAEWDERHLLEPAQLDLVTGFLLRGEVRGLQPLIAQLISRVWPS